MAKRKNKGLGIGALLGNIDTNIDSSKEKKQKVVSDLSNTVAQIKLEAIEVNPFQPRATFDEDALQELADSIEVHGLIQPITVRHLGNGKFQLISGERRLRASKMAGLEEVPAFVRLANDQEMIEMALIENIQREELNPIEIAITYGRLMKECKLTHKQLAERVGKGRTTITNYTRLLNLPEKIQNGLRDGEVSMGHAKALMGIEDFGVLYAVYDNIIEKGLSVRDVESLVKLHKGGAKKSSKTKKQLSPSYRKRQDWLATVFDTKVKLKADASGKGKIVINFDDTDELNRILDIIDRDED